MNLLVLMYHRARAGRLGNSPARLDDHFAHVSRTYANVLPGDPLNPAVLNVCLSFDDGYLDFYTTVFPLLLKYRLRALLAIPPGFVRERIDLPKAERLGLDCDEAFANPERGGFCTWPELEEMARSGHVAFAAHGYTHRRLDLTDVNLSFEMDVSKKTLAARLGREIDSFVFPYGRYSPRALDHAKRSYRYAFRIGGALNCSWSGRPLYRVDADAMESAQALFSPGRLLGYRARHAWNRLRFR